MQGINLNGMNKDALLKLAQQKLGTDPEQLRQKLESGNIDEVLQGLDPQSQAKVNGILQNPQALKALLGNSQVQNLLKNLSGK